MTDEVTFRNHLKQLENLLKVLENDIENAPKDKITPWYDDMTDIITKTQDNIESVIYPVNEETDDEYRSEEIEEVIIPPAKTIINITTNKK